MLQWEQWGPGGQCALTAFYHLRLLCGLVQVTQPLGVCFRTCKMGIIIEPASWGGCKD